MAHKCRDCKDTKIYQGLGAPERCKSCLYDVEQSPPRLNHVSVKAKSPIDHTEIMRLIDAAVKTGANLDDMLKGRKVATIIH